MEFDLLVVGGGVNGAGVARDSAGRGLSVLLVEQDDLASATSSASTKLVHGGLRYLEYYGVQAGPRSAGGARDAAGHGAAHYLAVEVCPSARSPPPAPPGWSGWDCSSTTTSAVDADCRARAGSA
ncbi:FAD-dependent oxidoreductase [Caulobacter segnis]